MNAICRFRAARAAFGVGLGAMTSAILLTVAPAGADPVADFFRNRTVTYVQASGAGGGYAAYSRLVEKHLPKFIPGNPNIQLQFMPGAGGVKGANYLYNVAPKDGSAIGMPLNNVAVYQVLRPDGVKYDTANFTWLIGLVQLNSAIIVWHTAPAKTLEDARKTELVIGSTAKSADNYQQPVLANNLLGTKFKMVTGYDGSPGMNLAMERGETHGRMTFWESLVTTNADWIREKKFVALVQIGARPIKELPDVPQMIDLVKTPEDKAAVRLMHVNAALGRTIYAPPGIPAARAAALRKALETMAKDPAFLADAEARKVSIDVTTADELKTLIGEALTTPPAQVERYKQAVEFN